ncbi:stage II sporulation protein P [Carboxydocella sp. JDF658]|uniref:stage II sporulation protein P n=1 Tax=Carboxydocella sp. JDF658 TaxID=1926600 RepID=UPI0009AD3331|nr:stage II sporulation protein P [Carboxydocella sp. JDF658]GAW31708.1 hypothetical protein JDF658_14730 [Carboxydocella sp. JDF658]
MRFKGRTAGWLALGLTTLLAAWWNIPTRAQVEAVDKVGQIAPKMDARQMLQRELPLLGTEMMWTSPEWLPVGKPQVYLAQGIPFLRVMAEEEEWNDSDKPVARTDRVVDSVYQPQADPHEEVKPEQVPGLGQFRLWLPAGQKVPLVGIYNTHTSETYRLTDKTDKVPGEKGGVFAAASALAEELSSRYGIGVVQSQAIHDENWLLHNPYANSAVTARQMLEKYPDLQLLIDIHRDAEVPRENSVVKIQGREAARIMLVVGTNSRGNHPSWQKNLAFAQQLAKQIEQQYPGLVRKVLTKPGRYNQHLHPRAVLIEIGSTSNSTAEAEYTARLLAKMVADVVKK